MKLHDEIIKAITLGVDKYTPQSYTELGPVGEKLAASGTEKEDVFLKLSAVVLTYVEAGEAGEKINQAMPPCNAEVKKIVNQAVHEVMLTCHQTKNEVLFDYLLDTCNQHNRIVPDRKSVV